MKRPDETKKTAPGAALPDAALDAVSGGLDDVLASLCASPDPYAWTDASVTIQEMLGVCDADARAGAEPVFTEKYEDYASFLSD